MRYESKGYKIKGYLSDNEMFVDLCNVVSLFQVAGSHVIKKSKFYSKRETVIESFKVVAKYFKHKRLGTEYVVLQDDMMLKHVDEVLRMLSAFTGDPRHEKAYEEHLKEKAEQGEKIAMCNGIQYWEDKGRDEANIETAKRMLKRGLLTCKEIAEDSGLSLEQVEAIEKEMKSELQLA